MANNAAGLAGYFKSGRFIPSPFFWPVGPQRFFLNVECGD